MRTDNDLIKSIITGIQDRKGKKIVVIDLSGIESASAEYFIICEGTSSQQVAAIADNVREHIVKELHMKPFNDDGYATSQWIVLDYGNIYVHVFQRESRDFYNLEQLWSDAKLTVTPDLD